MSAKRLVGVLAGALLLIPSEGPAQQSGIEPGQRVRLVLAGRPEVPYVGELIGWSADSVRLRLGEGGIERALPTAAIAKLEVSAGGTSRGRGALKGTAIGTLVAAAVIVTSPNDIDPDRAVLGTLELAGLGALIGVLGSGENWVATPLPAVPWGGTASEEARPQGIPETPSTREMAEDAPPPVRAPAPPRAPARASAGSGNWKNPALAGVLEVWIPTLGTGYAGDWNRGLLPGALTFLGIALTTTGMSPGVSPEIGVPLFLAARVWGIAAAVDAARDHNHEVARERVSTRLELGRGPSGLEFRLAVRH